jgi:hypothetical protein
MTKMFKHVSEHFLPFFWVYLIPTYVRQLPPPPPLRNPFLNMDSSPCSSVASPSLEGCSPSAPTAKASILSCFSSDGSFDSGKYMLYAVACSSCTRRSILMAMNNSPGHGGSTAAQAEDWVTPVKTRAKKCVLAHKLGWEFRFLVPISGTPIVSGIPIPFSIPKIPVGFFF